MPKRVRYDGRRVDDHDVLARRVRALRRQGQTIGLVVGDFDLFGAGAARALNDAAGRAQHLVVGLLSAESLRTMGDEWVPCLSDDERAEILFGFEHVHYVTFVDIDDVPALVERMRPTMYAHPAHTPKSLLKPPAAAIEEADAHLVTVGDARAEPNHRMRARVTGGSGAQAATPRRKKVAKKAAKKVTRKAAPAKVRAKAATKKKASKRARKVAGAG